MQGALPFPLDFASFFQDARPFPRHKHCADLGSIQVPTAWLQHRALSGCFCMRSLALLRPFLPTQRLPSATQAYNTCVVQLEGQPYLQPAMLVEAQQTTAPALLALGTGHQGGCVQGGDACLWTGILPSACLPASSSLWPMGGSITPPVTAALQHSTPSRWARPWTP